MTNPKDAPEVDQKLRAEIVGLVQYIRRFREEIAQMVASDSDAQTRFDGMSDQLDAIVQATEDATNSILENMEAVDSILTDLRDADEPTNRASLCDDLENRTMAVIEACTFQDITGQRVNKIVRSMKFVEDRIGVMVELWGEDEIDKLAGEYTEANRKDNEDNLLKGPALESEASISQDEIDKLFG